MTPLKFETDYASVWQALEGALDRRDGHKHSGETTSLPLEDAELAAHYRRCCEHLALAQARGYPMHLIHRLEQLTQRAHQHIYRRRDYGLHQLGQLALIAFPQAVRAHRWYLLASTLLFVLPLFAVAWASYRDPGFILHLMDAAKVRDFDGMYGHDAESIGRLRSAGTDWNMFGYYIMNNIGIGFQCFASGIFGGLGSIFYLVFNGLHSGAVAGFLVASGHATNFFSFVVTHAAFELTAIVLAGAAGLRLGHAIVSPQRQTRLQALKDGAQAAITVVYGVVGMLFIAAGIEAFWSSAAWITPGVKYGVGAGCWALVLAYLTWQGRATPAFAKSGGVHAG
jgi:uncharacterized membrane protein SpoIIM required for sporulation